MSKYIIDKNIKPLLLNIDEVSIVLGIRPRTIWRLVKTNQVPLPIQIGRSVRWRRSDVLKWVNSRSLINEITKIKCVHDEISNLIKSKRQKGAEPGKQLDVLA